MRESDAPKLEFINHGGALYIVVDGVKLAKRGNADRSEPSTWETLKPGWSIVENGGGVQFTGPRDAVKLH